MASKYIPTWFYRLASPKWCYGFIDKYAKYLLAFAVLLLSIGTVWGLAYAPADYQQGNSFRIIYVHVPTAIIAQSFYMLMALAGAISLIWKIKVADMVAKSIAPIGASVAFLALITGAIWGKPTWGSWWVWDARLTSMLILMFLYLGIMALHSSIESSTTAAKATAVLALVGVVNIPIIKYSVEWWNTLHQPATFKLTEKPAMPPEMWMPLLVMLIGIYAFFAYCLSIRVKTEILEREKRTSWVSEIITGAK